MLLNRRRCLSTFWTLSVCLRTIAALSFLIVSAMVYSYGAFYVQWEKIYNSCYLLLKYWYKESSILVRKRLSNFCMCTEVYSWVYLNESKSMRTCNGKRSRKSLELESRSGSGERTGEGEMGNIPVGSLLGYLELGVGRKSVTSLSILAKLFSLDLGIRHECLLRCLADI